MCQDGSVQQITIKKNQKMTTFPFANNFFNDHESPKRTAPLEADTHADVIIVGAGIVGLTSAYALRKEGLDVALVEREHVGFGSSGRHLGHITPHAWDFGKIQPERLAAWAQNCLEEIEAVVNTESIECEFKRCPYYTPTNTEAAAKALPSLVKYYTDLGIPASLIPSDDFDLVTYQTHGAMMLDKQGRCNPYKLVRGLREVVLRMGVRLYEGTNVETIAGGDIVKIGTSGGTLTAPHAVLALNGHAGEFDFLKSFLRPAHTYCMITEPMDETTARTVGPAHSEDFLIFDYGPGEPHFYQRFRSDHRLIFGGGGTPPADPSKRMASEDDQSTFQNIHTEMLRRYPKLSDVKIEAAWGSPMAMTRNSSPLITALPEHKNVTLAIIGNGNGIGLGSNAGALVKGMVMGKNSLDPDTRAFLEYCGIQDSAA